MLIHISALYCPWYIVISEQRPLIPNAPVSGMGSEPVDFSFKKFLLLWLGIGYPYGSYMNPLFYITLCSKQRKLINLWRLREEEHLLRYKDVCHPPTYHVHCMSITIGCHPTYFILILPFFPIPITLYTTSSLFYPICPCHLILHLILECLNLELCLH